jgi:hypothetical protein
MGRRSRRFLYFRGRLRLAATGRTGSWPLSPLRPQGWRSGASNSGSRASLPRCHRLVCVLLRPSDGGGMDLCFLELRDTADAWPLSPSYGTEASNGSRARLRAYERGKVEGDGSGDKSVVQALRSILACSPASIHPAAAGIWGGGDGCSVTGEEGKGEKLRKDGRCQDAPDSSTCMRGLCRVPACSASGLCVWDHD